MKAAVKQILSVGGRLAPGQTFLILLTVAGLMVTSCSSDDDGEPSNKPACQVVKQTSTTHAVYDGAVTFTDKAVYTYGYDAAGNITETMSEATTTYSDGKTAKSSISNSYQYDKEGFVLRSLHQGSSTARDATSSNWRYDEEYSYENGRIATVDYKTTTDGTPKNYAEKYEYDSEGKVIKYTSTYSNSTIGIEYDGEIVKKLTYTDAAGNVSSPFLQYNEKGLLVKGIETSSSYTDEYRYEYTSEGLLIREERYINGEPSSGNVYEYDTKENPGAYLYALKKGIPRIPSTRPNFNFKYNYAGYTNLTNNDDLTGFKTRSSTIFVYDYNDKNFPKGYTSRTVDASGVEIASVVSTYEYQNCP